MSDALEIETDGHVRFLRLNRPDRKNALTTELGWAIVEAVRAASSDDTVRAIGIVGNGDAFCSGLDLAGSGGRRRRAVTGHVRRPAHRLLRRATVHTDLEAHASNEIRLALRGLGTEDSAAAIDAMATKQAPTFEGR